MGLGVYLIADLLRRGWLKKPPAPDRLFQMIIAATSAFVARQPAPLAGWMSALAAAIRRARRELSAPASP
jgi:hypothetical protein